MAYTIYDTEAFVLGSSPTGEANRTILLFTRDFGLVRAHAQGIRYEKSKLRHGLLTYALVRASLVRGKQVWRLTGLQSVAVYQRIFDDVARTHALSKSVRLIERLAPDEALGEHALFDDYAAGLMFLDTHTLSVGEIRNFEAIMACRILAHLGYFPGDTVLDEFATPRPWTTDMLTSMERARPRAVLVINDALKRTQL